jgi:hypothetical protein
MNKLVALVVLALLATASVGSYRDKKIREQKREDEVATFALEEIAKRRQAVDCSQPPVFQEPCKPSPAELRAYMQTHTSSEIMTASMDCITRNANRTFAALDACQSQANQQQAHDLAVWEQKYPRQAAQRKAKLLEAARQEDAKSMSGAKQ